MPPRTRSQTNKEQSVINKVKTLIAKRGNLNEVDEDDGNTMLFRASKEGNLEIVRLLVEGGADMDKADYDGRTPLYVACKYGHIKIVQLLLDAGADIDKEGWRVGTPLWIASEKGDLKIVKLLIEKGANLDIEGNLGTPLYIASLVGLLGVVRLLVDAGADIDKGVWAGKKTPLWIASKEGRHKIVKLLIEKGAKLDETDIEDRTPLLMACRYGHLAVVRLLVEAGADKDKASREGWTPLNYASNGGHLEMVRLLIEKGANLDKATKVYFWTALYIACWRGHLEIVRLLVEAGANIAKKAKDGNTPLDIAIDKEHTDIIDYLLSTIINKKLNIKHPRVEAFKNREEFLKNFGDTEEKQKEKLVEFLSMVCHNNDTEIFTQEEWNEFDLEDLLQIILYEPISKKIFYIRDLNINKSNIKHYCYDGESLVSNIKTIEGNIRDGIRVADVRDPMTRKPYTQNNIKRIKNNLLGGSKNTNKTLEIYIPNSIKTIKKLKYKKNTPFDGLQKIGTLVVSKSLLKKKDSTKKQPTKTKESTKKQPTKTKESTKKQPTKTK
jgi:ankyrin repeat protein